MNQPINEPNTKDDQPQLESFISWFRQLDGPDQLELMRLVYNEHKIRDVVRTFSGMPMEQQLEKGQVD